MSRRAGGNVFTDWLLLLMKTTGRMRSSLLSLQFWNRRRMFWLFHISGWIFITLILYLYYGRSLENSGQLFRFFSYYIGGFLVTLALRPWLRKLTTREFNPYILLLIIFLVAFVSTMVIYIIHFLVSIPSLKSEYPELTSISIIYDTLFWKFLMAVHSFIVFLIVFLWQILYIGIKFFLDLRAERETSREAQLQAQQAQLEMLRYQLNPHFLFNSLNSIWALVDEDPRAVKKMVNELSDFLRYSLLFDHQPFKPLSHEIEALKNYFSIEKKRFQENLVIDLDIAEETNNCRVLSFILQPFVENAIKFGMLTSELPLKIELASRMEGKDLVIHISNTGNWVDAEEHVAEDGGYNGTGRGIQNAVNRLDIAYPGRYQLLFEKLSHKVIITLVIRNIETHEAIQGNRR
jgi:sensor histidine kinase YesM